MTSADSYSSVDPDEITLPVAGSDEALASARSAEVFVVLYDEDYCRVSVRLCVYERDREREREKSKEREREREREREKERFWKKVGERVCNVCL